MNKLLDLTAVWYEEGDRLGYALAIISLAPILIFTSLTVLTLCTDPPCSDHHLKLLLGQVLNEVLSMSLKQILRIPRPLNGPPIDDYGMPSRHAQFMGFLVGYWNGGLPGRMRGGERWWRGCGVVGAVMVCWSRCYLKYHSVGQVLVGAVIGFVFARVYAKFFP